MRFLVDWARLSIGLASVLLILAFVIGGAGAGNSAGLGLVFGAILGGILGLLVAGTIFGLAAAIVDMHSNTQAMVSLMNDQATQVRKLLQSVEGLASAAALPLPQSPPPGPVGSPQPPSSERPSSPSSTAPRRVAFPELRASPRNR